ncbi:MAG: aminotransferase class III-fold pyridoxal phosphate-dependent enzyme, partial [Flavobacteriales bacterium]|nr:aminotransferase class III-fold pyridoxal phosphate-dependent enzyme [Flavobacteriales bacterium]
FTKETIVLPLNNKEAIEAAFKKYKNDIACIIIEPVPANNGLLIQEKSYLKFLRQICTANKSLLIFDEVISGFRIGFEGASGHYKIKPDIITYGKIIGGGLPVGAYGASNKIMTSISPLGDVYQAGTLSGNPVAMSAGIAQLTECLKKNFYTDLNTKTDLFVKEIDSYIKEKKYKATITSIGSIFWISFSDKTPIRAANEIKASTMSMFTVFYSSMLNKGIYTGPSGYEVGFMSSAHSKADLVKTKKAICESLDKVFK